MINFEFIRPTDENPEGIITVSVDYESTKFFDENQFPLHLQHKTLSGEVYWQTDLNAGWFSQFLMNTYTTVELIDSLGNKIFEWVWDPFIHGDYAHQYFESWALKNRGSNGIAIGTHNGMTGEWVGPINKGLLKGTLVESSEPQFSDLEKYYKHKPWINLKKELVTTDGSNIIFYEGGNGFTNSTNKDIISGYVEEQYIKKQERTSISINNLIEEVSKRGNIKWIHIDVEGMDGDLVYSIEDSLLPDLLIFESLHMDSDYKNNIKTYLESKNYFVKFSGWNTICIKNK